MILRTILLVSLQANFVSFGQQKDSLSPQNVKQSLENALNYLVKSQIDSTILEKQYKGEWYVTMELTEPYVLIGKKQKHKDSNGFTVSAIHNFIAEIYLSDTSLTYLKPCLAKAFAEIQSYKNEERYNFWKLLPPNRDLRLFKEPKSPPLVRRPTEYHLKSRFINNAANVPEDADDISLGNLATFYNNKIFNDSLKTISYAKYDLFLDKNRKNYHWYNHLFAHYPESGAFLTWHAKEHEFSFLKVFRSYLNTFFIFLPISTARPKAYQAWIPFGSNDVDIVVNANVLNYLAISGQLEQSIGKKGSINLINWLLKHKQWSNNTVYYPNLYTVHYAVAKAYSSGVEPLKTASELILANLLANQNPDGSYESAMGLNQKDINQSTAYALHALLDLKKAGFNVPNENIKKAIVFLLSKAKISDEGMSWEGGVFFSGGTLLHNILLWKSDAYTTDLIANSLSKYLIINHL